jgi:predicted nucleotidyltransferase
VICLSSQDSAYVLNQAYLFVNEIISQTHKPTIYLVGSYAIGIQTAGSDIDLLVFIDQKIRNSQLNSLQTILKHQYTDFYIKTDSSIYPSINYSIPIAIHDSSQDYNTNQEWPYPA